MVTRTLALDHFKHGGTDAGLAPIWAWQDGRTDARQEPGDGQKRTHTVRRCLLRNVYSCLIFTATRELARDPGLFFTRWDIRNFLRVVYGRCELLRGPSSAAPPASDGYGPGTPQLSSSANFHADTQQFIAGAPELLAAGGRTA